MTKSKTIPKTISLPADWYDALQAHAQESGTSFSELITRAAIEKLPASVRRKLSERPAAHRPRVNSDK